MSDPILLSNRNSVFGTQSFSGWQEDADDFVDIVMSTERWERLGSPESISVTVEPADADV